jgi:peroxiredoxin
MAMQSTMLALGTAAPTFRLPDAASGKTLALEDFAASRALLVAFICNHCPYVKHMLDGFVAFAREYSPRGLAVVAISSNDVTTHPADSPHEMAKLAREKNFTFPYLYDESQAVARAYDAVCTPDFFLFDGDRRLVYRGQFDGTRPGGRQPVTGADMRAAADAVLAGKSVPTTQFPSVGCGIKWKAA